MSHRLGIPIRKPTRWGQICTYSRANPQCFCAYVANPLRLGLLRCRIHYRVSYEIRSPFVPLTESWKFQDESRLVIALPLSSSTSVTHRGTIPLVTINPRDDRRTR